MAETKESGEIAIKSKRGNTIKKNASHDNPAVHVERTGNDVVKRASELTVEAKASENKKGGNSGRGKRKTTKAGNSKTGDDDDGNGSESESDEIGDAEDPHTINKQGKEVRKGGKEVNKRQKTSHKNGDVAGKSNADTSKTSGSEEGGSEEGESEEERAGREDGRGHKKFKQANNANKNKEPAKTDNARGGGNKGGSKSTGKRSRNETKNDPARREGDTVSKRTRSHV